ncbi:MAG: hypothetical protein ABFC78_11960 [Methanoregula sp.]|jgi:hypothetical protein
MENKKLVIEKWPESQVSGAKRATVRESILPDWFVGFGKDESCDFEGTWWDMICFARNILASENTRVVAPEFHKPEWKNENYVGEERPYLFGDETE